MSSVLQFSTAKFCILPYCISQYCTELHCRTQYCNVIYCIVHHIDVFRCIVHYSNILQGIELHCTALPNSAYNCNVVRYTVKHCLYCSPHSEVACTVLGQCVLYITTDRCSAVQCTVDHSPNHAAYLLTPQDPDPPLHWQMMRQLQTGN